MCIGNSPSAPTPPPRAPEAAQTPTAPSRRKSGTQARGNKGTFLTTPRGVLSDNAASTSTKTLLGQ